MPRPPLQWLWGLTVDAPTSTALLDISSRQLRPPLEWPSGLTAFASASPAAYHQSQRPALEGLLALPLEWPGGLDVVASTSIAASRQLRCPATGVAVGASPPLLPQLPPTSLTRLVPEWLQDLPPPLAPSSQVWHQSGHGDLGLLQNGHEGAVRRGRGSCVRGGHGQATVEDGVM